jgi:hypothetical protein
MGEKRSKHGEKINGHRGLTGNPERKRRHERYNRIFEDNIKVDQYDI